MAPVDNNVIVSGLKKFAYSDLYFIIIAIFVVSGWASKISAVGFFSLIIISSIMLVALDDILPLMANVFFAPLMLYSDDINDYLAVWPILIPLGVAIVIFIIINIRNKKFTLGKMFIPQLLVSIVLLIGGVGIVSKEGYMTAFPLAFVLGFGVLICYVIANHFLKNDDKRDYPLIFSKIMMYVGVAVSIELIIASCANTVPFSEWDVNTLNLGWGNRNNAATLLLITIPLTIYIATRYKKAFIYLLLAILQSFCLFSTISKIPIIIGIVEIIISCIVGIIKAPNRNLFVVSVICGVLVSLFAYLIFLKDINNLVVATFKYSDWVDRSNLYSEATLLFKDHWLIGVGVGYVGTNFEIAALNFYYFHSTLFQVMACMGIVGIVAYVVYYVYRFGVLFKNIKNCYSLFTLISWISFEVMSMFDTGTFVPFPNMILIIVMTLILERSTLPSKNTYVDEYNCCTRTGAAIAYALYNDDYVYEYQPR